MPLSRRIFAALSAAAILTTLLTSPAAAGPAANVTVTPEIKVAGDFSAMFRGYWWDFSDISTFGWEQSRDHWSGFDVRNGWLLGTSEALPANPSESAAAVRLSNLSLPGAIDIASEHPNTPIDPSFKWFTVRMCASEATQAVVYWHADGSFADRDWGFTYNRNIRPGCNIYTWDLVADRNPKPDTLPYEQGGWQSIRIRPALDPGVDIAIDYASLTKRRRAWPITIGWDPALDPMSFHLTDNPQGVRRTIIARDVTAGSLEYRTPNLPPGEYWIVAEKNGQFEVGPSFHVNAPPTGRIISPSFTSGPSYADDVLGNPWDMSDPADTTHWLNLTASPQFADGEMTAINPAGNPGPNFVLSQSGPIDPDEWYWLTYRMKVDVDHPRDGGVVRIVWLTAPETPSASDDIVIYKDWQEVSVDLRAVALEPEAPNPAGPWGEGPIIRLRIDPHESTDQRRFHVDHVSLNSIDVARLAYLIQFEASDSDGTVTDVRFFFAPGHSAAGRQRIPCVPHPDPTVCKWRAMDVPNGDYYIHMIATDDDGGRIVVVSDAPVRVAHA